MSRGDSGFSCTSGQIHLNPSHGGMSTESQALVLAAMIRSPIISGSVRAPCIATILSCARGRIATSTLDPSCGTLFLCAGRSVQHHQVGCGSPGLWPTCFASIRFHKPQPSVCGRPPHHDMDLQRQAHTHHFGCSRLLGLALVRVPLSRVQRSNQNPEHASGPGLNPRPQTLSMHEVQG